MIGRWRGFSKCSGLTRTPSGLSRSWSAWPEVGSVAERMIDSEATQAGRIRQSEERCPDCGHVPKKYADLREWGVALRDGKKVAYHKETFCLRRQLAEVQERAETAEAHNA